MMLLIDYCHTPIFDNYEYYGIILWSRCCVLVVVVVDVVKSLMLYVVVE